MLQRLHNLKHENKQGNVCSTPVAVDNLLNAQTEEVALLYI